MSLKIGLLVCFLIVLAYSESPTESYFKEHGVVPDVIERWPDQFATVTYPNGVIASNGNELTPSQVKKAPSVKWDAVPQYYYTLAMVDPDAPSRVNPIRREWLHWLVTNIPGDNMAAGDVIASYSGSKPPKDTGLHRYVILVYKQPSRLEFDELILDNTNMGKREKFSIAKFARKHNFQVPPVAGNFFTAQYEA